MSAARSAAVSEILPLYDAALAHVPGATRKGASMPYTALNGNMWSFLDKAGVLAIRLDDVDREALLAKRGGKTYVHETGAVMDEYVALSPALLSDPQAVADWLAKSLAYAKTLRPKTTSKKKAAA